MESQEVDFSVLMARQPVIDREKNSHAYNLLYQDDQGEFIPLLANNRKTAQALLNRFASLPADRAIEEGRKRVFINIHPELLKQGMLPDILYPAIIVEVENPNEEQSEKLLKLKKKYSSFQYCLDHFQKHLYSDELIEKAAYIKYDQANKDINFNKKQHPKLKSFYGKLIATNLQTPESYRQSFEQGFDLFQGDFLIKPEISNAELLSGNAQSTLLLLSELYNPDTTPEKIERTIVSDTELTTQLLRLINSAAFGFAREINSIKEAIVFLGLSSLKKWVSLLILSAHSHKSPELVNINLTRAAFCKELAILLESADPDQAFLMGIMSMIDVYLDWPLDQILTDLPLSETINSALLKAEGPLGDILTSACNYEQSNWQNLQHHQLDQSVWSQIYQNALIWSQETLSLIPQ